MELLFLVACAFKCGLLFRKCLDRGAALFAKKESVVADFSEVTPRQVAELAARLFPADHEMVGHKATRSEWESLMTKVWHEANTVEQLEEFVSARIERVLAREKSIMAGWKISSFLYNHAALMRECLRTQR